MKANEESDQVQASTTKISSVEQLITTPNIINIHSLIRSKGFKIDVLDEKKRNHLINMILDFAFENDVKLARPNIKNIAQQIGEIFPDENAVRVIYLPFRTLNNKISVFSFHRKLIIPSVKGWSQLVNCIRDTITG